MQKVCVEHLNSGDVFQNYYLKNAMKKKALLLFEKRIVMHYQIFENTFFSIFLTKSFHVFYLIRNKLSVFGNVELRHQFKLFTFCLSYGFGTGYEN